LSARVVAGRLDGRLTRSRRLRVLLDCAVVRGVLTTSTSARSLDSPRKRNLRRLSTGQLSTSQISTGQFDRDLIRAHIGTGGDADSAARLAVAGLHRGAVPAGMMGSDPALAQFR
jgi:hypothetical protein